VRDLAELVAHARHIADVIGPEHLALGTDLNGVPGVMAGYRGAGDLPLVTGALLSAGFDAQEVASVLGGNALRVLREVEARAKRSPRPPDLLSLAGRTSTGAASNSTFSRRKMRGSRS
jgi:hypothetical protein